jgi:endonuclease/exonuclease/phosphatase family metal-dependent hydrolase
MKRHGVDGRAALALCAALLLAAVAGGCDVSGTEGGGTGPGKTESEKTNSLVIMTWNVQALFDGTETGNEYDEYRESAGWSAEKYAGRLNGIASAIGAMEPLVPDLIALQEIESAEVLQDMAGALSKQGYAWSHFANNPGMSLGVGVLSRLPLNGTKVHSVNINGEVAPRPVLETRISAENEALTLFICHWKSKLGGEDATEAARRASARIILRRIRELAEQEPAVPVIVVGDLNENHDEFFRRNGTVLSALLPDDIRAADLVQLYEVDAEDPDAEAIVNELQKDYLILSKNKPPEPRYFPSQATALYSPWGQELGNGSYYYQKAWETIDHILLSAQLFNGTGWEYETSETADYQPFVNSSGYPAPYNPKTGSGLSDHLPLLLFLTHQR